MRASAQVNSVLLLESRERQQVGSRPPAAHVALTDNRPQSDSHSFDANMSVTERTLTWPRSRL